MERVVVWFVKCETRRGESSLGRNNVPACRCQWVCVCVDHEFMISQLLNWLCRTSSVVASVCVCVCVRLMCSLCCLTLNITIATCNQFPHDCDHMISFALSGSEYKKNGKKAVLSANNARLVQMYTFSDGYRRLVNSFIHSVLIAALSLFPSHSIPFSLNILFCPFNWFPWSDRPTAPNHARSLWIRLEHNPVQLSH